MHEFAPLPAFSFAAAGSLAIASTVGTMHSLLPVKESNG